MKTVRLVGNTVYEIIPQDSIPVEKWYGKDFAKMCMEAPDEVEQGWKYDDGTFREPECNPPPPTLQEQLRADVDYIAIMAGVELYE